MRVQEASTSDLEAHSFPANVKGANQDPPGSRAVEAELAEMELEERAHRAGQAVPAGADSST